MQTEEKKINIIEPVSTQPQPTVDNKDEKTKNPKPIDKYPFKIKKKMSNKEIYRLLAFEFKQNGTQGIKISIISEMVSNLFYPFDEKGESKAKFKQLIEDSFKNYCHVIKDEITEEKFCEAMDSIDKYMNDETVERFLQKIFRRHDKDKDNLLNKEEFSMLMKNYKDENLSNKEIENIYESIAPVDSKGIDLKTFVKYSM